nr:cleavage/polyadenylation specificity factor, 25kDa subunit [Tanacetum cinerariifolium]
RRERTARNGVGIILAASLKDNRLGLTVVEKKNFWDSLDELVRECPSNQRLIIGGDLNGHIGADGYAGVHGGFGYGVRNDEGRAILEFATAHDLVVANSFFKKSDTHLITFQSAGHNTQIDFVERVVEGSSARVGDLSVYDANQMWNLLSHIIKDVAKDAFGVDSGTSRSRLTRRESWWFSEEVQTKVAAKQTRCRELLSCQEGHHADRESTLER